MILATTMTIEGAKIRKYCGVVTSEAVLGTNVIKELFGNIRDVVGGRSATYEKELRKARDIAMAEVSQQAEELGCNAVIGIDIDYQMMGRENGMMMVSVTGTAVMADFQ